MAPKTGPAETLGFCFWAKLQCGEGIRPQVWKCCVISGLSITFWLTCEPIPSRVVRRPSSVNRARFVTAGPMDLKLGM